MKKDLIHNSMAAAPVDGMQNATANKRLTKAATRPTGTCFRRELIIRSNVCNINDKILALPEILRTKSFYDQFRQLSEAINEWKK